MAEDKEPKRFGSLAAGDIDRIKATSGDNRAGFNTVHFELTGGAGNFIIESSPNAITDPSNEVWNNIDSETPANGILTASGSISFQQRAEAFRVKTDGTLAGDWWVF